MQSVRVELGYQPACHFCGWQGEVTTQELAAIQVAAHIEADHPMVQRLLDLLEQQAVQVIQLTAELDVARECIAGLAQANTSLIAALNK